MVTDLAIWKPDPSTKEFTVVSLHEGVEKSDVQDTCGWPVKFAEKLQSTPVPTQLELTTLRELKSAHCKSPCGIGNDDMNEAYICDYIRTPIGRFGGGLSSVRTDDLAAIPLKALQQRNLNVDWIAVDEVYMGCANQAGEDNRNVARMATLLAGLPDTIPGTTINRLCGSGMDAIIMAARAIKAGEIDIAIAAGVESMSRAPFVMPKAQTAFSRNAEIYDTTIGWRFVNPLLKAQYGIDSMPETAENVAEDFNISREDQDVFAARSQAQSPKRNGKWPFGDGNYASRNSSTQRRRNYNRQRRTPTSWHNCRKIIQTRHTV